MADAGRCTIASVESLGLHCFVFTDMVGSTETLNRVGEAQADELRRECVDIAMEAAREAGGRIVKDLGDGAMMVFSSAVRAVQAAIAIQQNVERRNRKTERTSLFIRIGVSAGEVNVEADDYFGAPVVLARPALRSRSCGSNLGH